MKKLLLLLALLVLAACDKPTSTADLKCDFDKDWQRLNVLYLENKSDDIKNMWGTSVNVAVVTYEDYAVVSADNLTTRFEKVREEKFKDEFGKIELVYKGFFPGSERTALLYVEGDIANKQILQYSFSFEGQKIIHDNGRQSGVAHMCDFLNDDVIKFNHHYKMPNKIERCITEICEKVYCENEECTKLSVFDEGNTKFLSQQEALALSSNWNYNDMKHYRNDGKLEEHEKDACEVLDRLNKFIDDNHAMIHADEIIRNVMNDCGDECRSVLATGEMGDFLIQIPETEELRKITNNQKNAKFLSVFNPNSYAKVGYCLVNVIPYSTMEKMGTPYNGCHYRIYCGAPEFMNYDEFYAIEVCNN